MRSIVVGLAALVVLSSSPARAADPSEVDLGGRVASLGRSLMSPFCPGRTLQACPSGQAAAWLADVRAWVAEGRTDAEIVRRLQARVPGFDLAGPPPSTGWLLGLAPIGLASSILIAAFVVLRRRRVVERPRARDEDEDEELGDVLDDELARAD